jgi:eukaryotic-like serine/threonine-protein kinase
VYTIKTRFYMPLEARARLGPYEIVAAIGAGGMGEVYKTVDPRLNRTVAIKVSKEQFSERLEREARAVAALNHPNICQISDIGADYLVMEFVDGVPVSPVDSNRKLLDIAVQIADGLAAAHAAGIVHRDLKPDNILIIRDGRVKLLDFGLAKRKEVEAGGDDPTRAVAVTQAGMAVGTIAYMSPGQARGQGELTPQSDQFSFGLVLYELATGKRAFQRSSAVENHDRHHSRRRRAPACHRPRATAMDYRPPCWPKNQPTATIRRAISIANCASFGNG